MTASMLLTVRPIMNVGMLNLVAERDLTASFISKMEENSGVPFFKAQVALARVWLGRDFGRKDVQKKVIIKKPQPTSDNVNETKKEEKKDIEELSCWRARKRRRRLLGCSSTVLIISVGMMMFRIPSPNIC